ncbi:DUF2817 domain-containing protein, partial [Bradyrhizobium shewense]|uniref:DUF2817 domain-containing protein n=1 Tax=Bradyrhizobium shewense TaxID=1761772 RepID=UPI00101AE2DE
VATAHAPSPNLIGANESWSTVGGERLFQQPASWPSVDTKSSKSDEAMLLIHAVTRYGFARDRRVTQEACDHNRISSISRLPPQNHGYDNGTQDDSWRSDSWVIATSTFA